MNELASQQPGAPAPFGHAPGLDGLRGLAVIAVLLYHAHFSFATGGFLGVSVFFTLSGYLITSLLLREHFRSGTISLGSFWSRRFRRLLPASLAAIAGVVIMGSLGAWDGDQLRALRTDVPGALGQVINWVFIAKGTSYAGATTAPSPLNHYWSLAIEEQFYVVFPVLALGMLALAKGRRWALVASSIVLIVASSAWNGHLAVDDINRAYFGLDTRLSELLAGVLLACATYSRIRVTHFWARQAVTVGGVLGAITLVVMTATVTVTTTWLYPWGLLVAAMATCGVILMGVQHSGAAKLIGNRAFRAVGTISYGLYLYHWPIFQWLTPRRTGLDQVPLFGVRMALTVAVAIASYHLLEQPIRSRRWLNGVSFASAVPVAAIVLLVGNLFVTADPPERQRSLDGLESSTTTTAPPPPPQRVLIVGDETAGPFDAAAVAEVATQQNAIIEVSSTPGCGLTNGGTRVVTGQAPESVNPAGCDQLPAAWSEVVASFQPDVVIVSSGFWDWTDRLFLMDEPIRTPADPTYTDFTNAELQSRHDEFAAGGATVFWATQPTQLRVLPGVVDDPSAVSENNALRTSWYNERLDELVAANPDARLLDMAAKVTSLESTPHDPLVRPDGVVLSESSATEVAASLLEAVSGVQRSLDNAATDAAQMPADINAAELPPAPEGWTALALGRGERPRIMMVGDSVAFGLGWALQEWGDDNGGATFMNRGKFNCPIARGGTYRFEQKTQEFPSNCDWATNWSKLIAESRPHEVVIFNGVWDVVDRILPGDRSWRHLGDSVSDDYFVRELLAGVDLLSSQGARVTLLTHHYIEVGIHKGFVGLPESEHARMDRYNELLAKVAELRPGVVTVIDLASYVQPSPTERPDDTMVFDGLHFTDPVLIDIADWLAPQLIDHAKQR